MIRPLLAGALALASGAASADVITVRYPFPEVAGYAFTWGFFGGEYGPVTGEIISTTLHIDYTADGALDAANFYFTFDVPTLDGEETHIGLTGTDLGWSGQGEFTYDLTTGIYNGEIREGRFGAEFDGGGTFTDSYIEFVVDADPVDPIFSDGFEPF